MSPHGSKLWEIIRFLANRLLTDAQRKKIKNFFAKLQRIPLKLMGVDALIESQKSEIERLKSRLTLLDGKFNIALYGLPQVGSEYRAISLESSFLNRYQPPVDLDYWAENFRAQKRASEVHSGWKKSQSLVFTSEFKPETLLVSGLDSPDLISEMVSGLKAIQSLKKLYLSDTSPLLLEKCKQVFEKQGFPGRDLPIQIEWICTDPMTVLLGLGGGQGDFKVDWIVSMNRYQRLAPSEQLHYLSLCFRSLRLGGCLSLFLPNLSMEEVANDGYWVDSKTFRPYSLSLLQSYLSSLSDHVKLIQDSDSPSLSVILKKSRD